MCVLVWLIKMLPLDHFIRFPLGHSIDLSDPLYCSFTCTTLYQLPALLSWDRGVGAGVVHHHWQPKQQVLALQT